MPPPHPSRKRGGGGVAHYGPGELCHNFSISNDLTQVVNFPNQIPDCDSHSPALMDLLFLLTLVFALQWLSLYLEILIMLLSQLPLALHLVHNGIPPFYHIAYDYFQADWVGLSDHLRDVPL